MLHTRTLAVAAASPLVIESVLPSWLVRVSGSHVVPKRSVGDRALSRGQISRKDMLDNYQKTREKYKCEYQYADSGHLISASFSVPSHRSAFYLGRTFTRSAARFVRACARLDVSIFRYFDSSIFRYSRISNRCDWRETLIVVHSCGNHNWFVNASPFSGSIRFTLNLQAKSDIHTYHCRV